MDRASRPGDEMSGIYGSITGKIGSTVEVLPKKRRNNFNKGTRGTYTRYRFQSSSHVSRIIGIGMLALSRVPFALTRRASS